MKVSRLERFYRIHAKFYNLTRRFYLVDRQRAVERLDIKPDHIVFDYGCGTGLNIPFLLAKTSPDRLIGIDYATAMLDIARRHYPWLKLIRGDITIPLIAPRAADRILCTYALSMVEDWQQALLQMKDALSETGVLVILDFHTWYGRLRAFYPPFKRWLHLHGVDTEQPVIPFMNHHFRHVEHFPLRSGYNVIIVATTPRG